MNIEKIKLEDKSKNFAWIYSIFKNGKLKILGDTFNKESFEEFKIFVKTVEEIYPDFWDLEIKQFIEEGISYINITGIIIHFPEIEIKNSRDQSHIIKDLFVKIRIRKDHKKLKIQDLAGGRTTLSYAEFSSNYFHSHLPGSITNQGASETPYWSTFCRGSGHINDFIAEINSSDITSEVLTPFLVQIYGLISWESLEGGPHRRISSISARASSGRISTITPRVKRAFYEKVKIHYTNKIPKVDFKINTDKYVVIDNSNFDTFITEISFSSVEKEAFLATKSTDGKYYQYGRLPNYREVPNYTNYFIFRGKKFKTIVGKAPETLGEGNIKWIIHPELKTFIKEKIEYDINKKEIRKSTINRYKD